VSSKKNLAALGFRPTVQVKNLGGPIGWENMGKSMGNLGKYGKTMEKL
jgi:hypothetical protein